MRFFLSTVVLAPLVALLACGDLRVEFTPNDDAGLDSGGSLDDGGDGSTDDDGDDGSCVDCDGGDGGTGDFEDFDGFFDDDGSDGFSSNDGAPEAGDGGSSG